MKFKQLITYAMISGFVISQAVGIPMTYVKAATAVTDTKDTSSTEVSQEQKLNVLLVKIKSVITIPSKFSQFEYSYNSYSTIPFWIFYWNTKDGNEYIHVTCDNDGHILGYYQYNNNGNYTTPKYLQSELKGKADTFLKKIVPAEYNKLSFKNSSYSGVYKNSYTYTYERTENGISVPDNYMTVSVDSITGDVREFNSNWNYTVTFPSSKVNITKEEATELLKKQLHMELEYQESFSSDGKQMLGELVYVPNHSYLAVDAKSRTIYDTKDTYSRTYGLASSTSDSSAMGEKEDSGNQMVTLTEEEMKKVQEIAGLMSKKEAIQALKNNSSYLIDAKATTQKANLTQVSLDPSNPDAKSYVWNITLTDPSDVDYTSNSYYKAYITATIDAKDGTVLSFRANTKDYIFGVDGSTYVKLSESDGLKKAQDFLKKNYSSMYNKTEYTDSYDGYGISYSDAGTKYGGKIYTFTRVNNSAKFPSNQIRVGVDLVTGKIYSLDYSWYNKVQFEANQNTISAETAFEKYLSLDGYDLVYEIATKYSDDTPTSSVRLVYRTNIYPSYIDAFTGEQVGYFGEKYIKEHSYSYTDIDQSTYKRAILILADMGIGFNSSTFQPDSAITKEEFNQLIGNVGFYQLRTSTLSGVGTLTREAAAQYAIETLKLAYIAKMDIFKVNYNDSSDVTSGSTGYVVLADQLKLLQSNTENKFRPKENLTRGEAAQLILQIIDMYQY